MSVPRWVALVAVAVLALVAAVGGVASLKRQSSETGPGDHPVTIIGAGDIAASGTETMANAKATGNLIRAATPDAVFTVGDNAYDDGTLTQYRTQYDQTWGSFRSITRPAPGNHEYHSDPPHGYIDYFGRAKVSNRDDAGLYYAWDVGNNWRAYAVNTEISTSGAQLTWLQQDLAAHRGMHYLMYSHHPRYTSATEHPDDTSICPLWDAFSAAGGDLYLAGHDHVYERFAKMDCQGHLKATGVRSFVVGSGGNQLYPFTNGMHPGEQYRNNTDYGVLKLVLHENSYAWSFIASGRGWNGSRSVDMPDHRGVVLDKGSDTTSNTAVTPAR